MVDEVKAIETETPIVEETKVEVEKPKEQTFNQAQLDNIIKSRLEAEHKKHQRTLDEAKKAEQDALKKKKLRKLNQKQNLKNLCSKE